MDRVEMRAIAWMRMSGDDRVVPVGHGDIVGRLPTAALRVDDGRVSEAHALVSLRGEHLKLLALRGRFRVAARVVPEVTLEAGLAIELAEHLTLHVERVVLPEAVLALALPDSEPVTLGGTTSILPGPPLTLHPGYRHDALLVIWALGTGWRGGAPGARPRDLTPGPLALQGGAEASLVLRPRGGAHALRTRTGLASPLRARCFPDGVLLQVVGGDRLPITGIPGRLAAVLLATGRPIAWRDVTALIWPDDRADERSLRRRLDAALWRLRGNLRTVGVDPGRIVLDGAGTLRFETGVDDRIEVLTDSHIGAVEHDD